MLSWMYPFKERWATPAGCIPSELSCWKLWLGGKASLSRIERGQFSTKTILSCWQIFLSPFLPPFWIILVQRFYQRAVQIFFQRVLKSGTRTVHFALRKNRFKIQLWTAQWNLNSLYSSLIIYTNIYGTLFLKKNSRLPRIYL